MAGAVERVVMDRVPGTRAMAVCDHGALGMSARRVGKAGRRRGEDGKRDHEHRDKTAARGEKGQHPHQLIPFSRCTSRT